jgi:hypothetical protein
MGQTSSWLARGWILIGATVQGANHLLEGVPCQDFHGFITSENSLAVAVADGLGSALLSQVGAEMAVKSALQTAGKCLSGTLPDNTDDWTVLLYEVFSAARKALIEEAVRQDHPLADFATTLILAIVTGDWLVAANIGDGAVVIKDDQGGFSTFCTPQNGEYVNETFSLTLPDALERVSFRAVRERIQNLGLLSDGLQRVAVHQSDDAPHVPFFAPLFSQLAGITTPARAASSLVDFLDSEKVRKLSGDDKTLVLVGRKNDGGLKDAN